MGSDWFNAYVFRSWSDSWSEMFSGLEGGGAYVLLLLFLLFEVSLAVVVSYRG